MESGRSRSERCCGRARGRWTVRKRALASAGKMSEDAVSSGAGVAVEPARRTRDRCAQALRVGEQAASGFLRAAGAAGLVRPGAQGSRVIEGS